ncbi:heme-binding protein 2 [Neosynchiropus ocellatus]
MWRIWIAALFGCLLLASAEARVGESPLCQTTGECLLYEVLCGNDKYEVRHYEAVKLVSTDEESYTIDISSFKGFRRLFKYITGSNEEGRDIDMTAPVIVRTNRKSCWAKSEDTISFVLPSAAQMNPPKPTDTSVYIHNMTDVTVYAMKYRGWMNFWTEKYKSDKFAKMLDDLGASYDKDIRFAAVYNSPMEMINRRNEVWFIAKGQYACPPQKSE